MKRYRLSALLKLCLIVVSCLAFITACEKDNNSQTNGGKVALQSFGPCPIQRGAELRIIGTNLDQVTSIILPGTAAITGDDIKRISASEIRVIVPQDATPGIISLQTSNQQTISSITSLTFSEPIIISTITPLTVKPGTDAIKITGDYLNLIEEIIFTDNVHVLKSAFTSQSRQEIDVPVPLKAQSGTIILSNGADIVPDANGNFGIPLWIYSTDTLNVIQPAITKISPNPIKAGSELTITGTNFDLADSVSFGGNVGVGMQNFVSVSATQIQVYVPANASDGVVKVIAFSGAGTESIDTLKLTLPAITSVAPNPVKNGATLTVTGSDLDLISGVLFTGCANDTTVNSGGTATQIQVPVPASATDGVVTFNTLSGQSVTANVTLVKPTITDISPATILAGDQVTITGTDLDLVISLTVGGISIAQTSFISQSATQIVIQSLSSCAVGTGNIVLTTVNGTQVTSTQQITINTPNIPAVTSISPSPVTVGNMVSLSGTRLNLVNSVVFMDASGNYTLAATQYGSRIDTLIEVYVPTNAKPGTVALQLNTYDGKQYTTPNVTIQATQTDLWTGSIGPIDWSGTFYTPVDPSLLTAGQTLGIDFVCDPSATYWQWEVMVGSWWTDFENWAAINGGNHQPNLKGTETNIEFTITQTDIDGIKAEGNAMLFAGNGVVIKRVYVNN